MRVVSIKPLIVKCMSQYFHREVRKDIARSHIVINTCHIVINTCYIVINTCHIARSHIVINTCQRATAVSRDAFLNIYHPKRGRRRAITLKRWKTFFVKICNFIFNLHIQLIQLKCLKSSKFYSHISNIS